jgi:hypothetical protein
MGIEIRKACHFVEVRIIRESVGRRSKACKPDFPAFTA